MMPQRAPRPDDSFRPAPAPASPSRRRFLGGGVALGLLAAGVRPVRALQGPNVTDTAWRELEQRLAGRLLRPGDAGFADMARPANLIYADVQPSAIARCTRAEDVAAAITWCRNEGLPFVARGGGHNYAGYSTTPGLMIDTGGMKGISYDAATGRLVAQAGVRNGDVHAALSILGRSVVHGRCATVGLAGFLLGGGIGFDMRSHGVGSDLMTSTRMVDATGQLRSLNERENGDLFWACRGGAGGNFGIHTEFELATFPVERCTAFDLIWTARAEEVAQVLIPALEKAPDGLGVKVAIVASPTDAQAPAHLTLLGQWIGERDTLMDILGPALKVAAPAKASIATLPYWDGQTLLTEFAQYESFRERSRFASASFGGRPLEIAFRLVRQFPGQHGSGNLKLFQCGGAMNKVPADRSAFVHRNSLWLIAAAAYWEEKETSARVARTQDWLDELYETLLPFCGEGAFQNFPDPRLVDAPRHYYGANLERLRRIKGRIDPDELFRYPQSIRPLAT